MSRSEVVDTGSNSSVVEGRHGRFRCFRHDTYIGRALAEYGEYSEAELQLLISLLKPGNTVVEAGANVGAFSVPLARHIEPNGRLMVFEPQTQICAMLRHNLETNGLDQVEVLPSGVGDRSETRKIAMPDYTVPGNFGGIGLTSGTVGEPVSVVRLDDAVDVGHLHLLKLDIEGMEREALEGASGLIATHRPFIYVENDRVDRSETLIQTLFDLGYRCFWHLPPLFNPENFAGRPDNVFGPIVSVNMLCVPQERNVGASADNAIRSANERPLLGNAPGAAGANEPTVSNDLSVAPKAASHIEAAIAHYKRALDIDPVSAETWSNLGNALRQCERHEEAISCAFRAVELDLDDALIAACAGTILRENDRSADALVQLNRACAQVPDNGLYRFERSVTLLTLGRYREGFADYEHRFASGKLQRRDTGAPAWQGEPLSDRTLLVLVEQGHGDMIQFLRFLPRVRALTRGRVQVECHRNLKRLVQATDTSLEVIAVGDPLPPHDLHISAPSLPHVLDLSDEEIAENRPYLQVPATGRFRHLLHGDTSMPQVGITWAGGKKNIARTCPFTDFLGITEIPGIAFYSLQRGTEREDIVANGATDLIVDLGGELDDFADDAEVIQDLDLVITIDTAMCHLAAALGKPTWTLLPYVADWRFGERRDDCPWYETMQLFRQKRPGDWQGVIADVRQALGEFARRWRQDRKEGTQ